MLKRYLWPGLAVAGSLLLTLSTLAGAAVVTLTPSTTSTTVGSTVEVSFRISGLGSTATETFSGFDIDVVSSSSAVLQFNGNFRFSPTAGGTNWLDLLTEPPPIPFDGSASDLSGRVDAFGVSGNSSAFLIGNQVDDFVFLTLGFDAIAVGGATVFIDPADPGLLFLDANIGDLKVDLFNAVANITVRAGNPVPEPGTATLALLGLAAGILSRRRSTGRNRPPIV